MLSYPLKRVVPDSFVLQQIRDTVKEVLPNGGRALLYGSQARGDAREDSDWDILILVDKARVGNLDFDEVAFPLIELGWKLSVDINPLIYTFADWQKRYFTPFYKNVEQDAIDL